MITIAVSLPTSRPAEQPQTGRQYTALLRALPLVRDLVRQRAQQWVVAEARPSEQALDSWPAVLPALIRLGRPDI